MTLLAVVDPTPYWCGAIDWIVQLTVMDNVIEHLLQPAVTVQRVRSWLARADA